MKTNEQNLREMWKPPGHPHQHNRGAKRDEKGKEVKVIFRHIMAEKFSNVIKITNLNNKGVL